ncbi:MAG: metallophosphoesterase [Oscillospiraceae bacterium]
MALFVMGDLHLSVGVKKPMDIFGGWDNYMARIAENWRAVVKEADTVVIPGDISWGMNLTESLADFQLLESLPGTKLLMKGNHDYWWTTVSKMEKFFAENEIRSLRIVHNNHFAWGEYGICGTRGWINEAEEAQDVKVNAREAGRLDASIRSARKAGLKPVVFLHYPPVYGSSCNYEILEVLQRHGIRQVFYGHIHGRFCDYAVNGERAGIFYRLVSSDYMKFCPLDITKIVQNDNF